MRAPLRNSSYITHNREGKLMPRKGVGRKNVKPFDRCHKGVKVVN